MEAIAERVDRVEIQLAQFVAQSTATIRHMDEMIAELKEQTTATARHTDATIAELKEQTLAMNRHTDAMIAELKEQTTAINRRTDATIADLKEESRKHTLEMARISDRIGRFAEDIVGPNIPRLAQEVFGISQFELRVERIDKPSRKNPARWREFDFVIAGNRKLIITETKSTARVKYIDDFAASLKEVFDYFPEFEGYTLVPIFASMALSPDYVRRLTRLKIYALALGHQTMELLNLPQVRARRDNGK